MGTYRIGLALGGGAARGWSHIGVIEALREAGIEPQVIAGTSMGALVGGAYAAGRLDALRDWALACDWRAIAGLLDVSFASGGLIDGRRIQRFLAGIGLDGRIEDLPLPYAAVATHLLDGREIWLENGPLDAAIRASIAMPGIISPTLIEDRWLVDGGLVNQVPVSTCRALGADFVIAVNVGEGLLEKHSATLRPRQENGQSGMFAELLGQLPLAWRAPAERILVQLASQSPASPGYFAVLASSLSIVQNRITRSRLAGEPPHAMITPQVAQISLMDFDMAADAIEGGRIAARHMLPYIQDQLSR